MIHGRSSAAVRIAVPDVALAGELTLPAGAPGLVVFAHGSGSSRFSPRNRYVADVLHEAGIATLLFDLLTVQEEREDHLTAHLRFDIPLLAGRLISVLGWLTEEPRVAGLRIGCFGASTGAAAALVAAARRPEHVAAVVSRGGRPDLAGEALGAVRAPTLFIVGGYDAAVLELNRAAMAQMHGPVRLEIVPGATHLFEEPGALDQVAHLAAGWFTDHLPGYPPR